jgi:hypothetical protein
MSTQVKEFDSKVSSKAQPGIVSAVDAAVGASFIAAGVGSTTFGLAIIGSEMSEGFKTAITLTAGAGPLSGKAAIGVVAFFLSWVILHYAMKGKHVKLVHSFTIGIVLIFLGVLFTYPPFFLLFAPE